MQRIILIGLATLLTACANQPSENTSQKVVQPETVSTYYDYQFASPQGEALSLNALPQELLYADVILIGEWHTHSAIHRFQTDFLKVDKSVSTCNVFLCSFCHKQVNDIEKGSLMKCAYQGSCSNVVRCDKCRIQQTTHGQSYYHYFQ